MVLKEVKVTSSRVMLMMQKHCQQLLNSFRPPSEKITGHYTRLGIIHTGSLTAKSKNDTLMYKWLL